MLKNRCNPLNLDDFEGLDKKRRELLQESEALKSQRNTVSKEISVMKKNKEDAEAKILEMRAVGAKISELDKELKDVEAQLRDIMLHIPNMPREDVPIGKDDTENPEVRKWGEPTKFDFEPKAHWDLGTELDILDADRAAKVTGARFTFYKGLGARLERACINFMMDLHANKHGYTEMLAPYIANKESMTGTGQLPKFADDMFKLEGLDYYLVPTAEVPTTNYHRDEILDGNKLPEYYSCYTACFRAEAGSAGRDTRGLIRQHQFNKVELIKFVKPETSWHELDTMVDAAEDVLRLLELPYHVVKLCTGDMSFTSATTYDLEVWFPRTEQVPRDLLVLELHGLSGAPRQHQVPPRCQEQAGIRPHAQRLGPRSRPHGRRDPRELPAGRWLGPHPEGPRTVHGRRQSHQEAGIKTRNAACDCMQHFFSGISWLRIWRAGRSAR